MASICVEEQDEEVTCWICSAEIIEYFEERYNGQRGKCTICEIDFPLE
ncbi:MAG: hypothetical protein OEL84_05630 [Nitrosopumilus sp.]|nr:hypothetical protein [Nitrosopumilus sp.]MDH3340748.1 hypothetical protein [Nitrosopumilus sp.]